ncbi:MAG: hypothetical protein KJ687_11125 [Proteobacteria bacterium]|nr:hypothetical protein [Pseudomonadota bacterium]
MGYYFRCPNEFFKSLLFKSDKPVSPSIALLIVISKVAFGNYSVPGADDTYVEIRPGQFPVDIKALQISTGWSEKKLQEFLYFLHDNNVLESEIIHGVTVATFNPDAVIELPPYQRTTPR